MTWGGYAGGIVANEGFDPNKSCTFYKDFGVEVEIKVIDDFEKSRDAFRAGGDKGGVDIMWSTVDAFALEYGGLETAATPRPSSSTTGAGAATPSPSTAPSVRWPTSRARRSPWPRRRRRTTSPSSSSPRADSPTATSSGCSRPRPSRPPTSSRQARWMPRSPGRPMSTSPPGSAAEPRSSRRRVRRRTSSPTSSWRAATSSTPTPRTSGDSSPAG